METKTPLLTKEEEHFLLKNRNDPEAKKKLLEAGKKGLIEAIEKFDCEKKRIRFASYAVGA